MIFNMIGSNGPSMKSTIIVSIDHGSEVGAYTDAACTTLVKTATERSEGEFWITGLNNGIYYIKAIKDVYETIINYTINQFGVYRITMTYTSIPKFTYINDGVEGNYEIVQDDDTIINDPASWRGNWKIRFLTSGTLNFTQLNGAKDGIDVFLVGGGGGNAAYANAGSGGGYTATYHNISVIEGDSYSIVIGAGGSSSAGGASSAFGYVANGGARAGAGGSGGGGSHTQSNQADTYGGTDGSDGTRSSGAGASEAGVGQHSTTREFGGYTIQAASAVSSAKQIPLSRVPSSVEQAFLNQGYLTIEKEGVTRTGRTNVVPISSYNPSTNTLTVSSSVTVDVADILRFGRLYSGGGAGTRYNGSTTSLFTYPGYTGGAFQSSAEDNSGGGSGGQSSAAKGGSGIIIIRNAR